MASDVMIPQKLLSGDRIELLSPGLGRAQLLVSPGQYLIDGQELGYFLRLSKRFRLRAPDGCSGKIVGLKDQSKVIDLAYGESFLSIDRSSAELGPRDIGAKNPTLDEGRWIESTMDGMFYLSPGPGDPPFVNVGDEISPGQTIGLIEVMKCFYPLKHRGDKPAKVIEVHVKNATPVSPGSKLYLLGC